MVAPNIPNGAKQGKDMARPFLCCSSGDLAINMQREAGLIVKTISFLQQHFFSCDIPFLVIHFLPQVCGSIFVTIDSEYQPHLFTMPLSNIYIRGEVASGSFNSVVATQCGGSGSCSVATS